MTYARVYNQFVSLSYPEVIPNTVWKRVLKLFGLLPRHEFAALNTDPHPWANIEAVVRAYGIREHICPRETIYGVISYSDEDGVLGFRVYGIHDGWRYLNPAEVRRYCSHRALPLPIVGTD